MAARFDANVADETRRGVCEIARLSHGALPGKVKSNEKCLTGGWLGLDTNHPPPDIDEPSCNGFWSPRKTSPNYPKHF